MIHWGRRSPQCYLYQYRARWYDPQLARFISQDPIGLAGGINPYVYAGSDPVNLRDPSGLSAACPPETYCLDPIVVVAQWGSLPFFRPGYDANNLSLNRGERVGHRVTEVENGHWPSVRFGIELGARAASYRARAEEVRQNGHVIFAGNSELRHACASYIMTDEYGPWSTRAAGVVNEIQGFVRWDIPNLAERIRGESPWAFQLRDLISNEVGIHAAKQGNNGGGICESIR